jgi:hypothetical protein
MATIFKKHQTNQTTSSANRDIRIHLVSMSKKLTPLRGPEVGGIVAAFVTENGKMLSVRDADPPIEIKIPVSDVTAARMMAQPDTNDCDKPVDQCMWLDTATGQYTADGCQMNYIMDTLINADGSVEASCLCTHLTEVFLFSTSYSHPPQFPLAHTHTHIDT